jgi:hypothetical protein
MIVPLISESMMPNTFTWEAWQREIVKLLRRDFGRELPGIRIEDIDWLAWETYYAQGKSPRQAIDRALERDL